MFDLKTSAIEWCREFGFQWNRFWFLPRDPYVLGVLRFLTGLVALYMVLSYSPDLVRFFGPDGMVPVDVVQKMYDNTGEVRFDANGEIQPHARFSYLDYCTTPSALWIAHVAGLLVLTLYVAGVFSRVTSILALVVVLSYIHRAIFLTWQAEAILAFVMFYLCLGPSGASWSVDRWLKVRRTRNEHGTGRQPADADAPEWSWGATVATRLLQIHLCAVYLMMAASKLSSPLGVWWNGTAVYWMLIKPESALVDLTFLRDHLLVLNAWTHAILAYEFAFPFMAWHRLTRPLVVAAGPIIWTLTAVASGFVTFSVIMLVANLSFVSPEAMRYLCGGWFKRKVTAAENREVAEPAVALR